MKSGAKSEPVGLSELNNPDWNKKPTQLLAGRNIGKKPNNPDWKNNEEYNKRWVFPAQDCLGIIIKSLS
jgi:hypothetical protein